VMPYADSQSLTPSSCDNPTRKDSPMDKVTISLRLRVELKHAVEALRDAVTLTPEVGADIILYGGLSTNRMLNEWARMLVIGRREGRGGTPGRPISTPGSRAKFYLNNPYINPVEPGALAIGTPAREVADATRDRRRTFKTLSESALAHKRRTGRPPQQARSEFTQP
jgi:hypothetical protein